MSTTQSLLQRFFDASLIPADTGDERLGHYQSAAADLAKRFSEAGHDAVSSCRVAVDPQCPASDPWFDTVQSAVKEHWKTFLTNHYDAPRQVSRGILLEALRQAAENDKTLACAIWYAGSNLLNHVGNGPEQAVVRELYGKLGEVCEAEAADDWRTSGGSIPKTPLLELKLAPPKTVKVDETDLENGLSDAAGPHNKNSKSFGNANPHWPNVGHPWSHEFSPRAAKAIATEINKALATLGSAVKTLNEQLDPGLNKFTAALGKMAADLVRRSERRSELVWWKNALYSPSLKRSYRSLSPVETVIVIAKDLSHLCGAPTPLSVEYFMRETIQTLIPSAGTLTLSDFLADAKTSPLLNAYFPEVTIGSPRRVSLPEVFTVARQITLTGNSLQTWAGIKPSMSLPFGEWAVWLLRENLATSLVTN